MTLARGWMTLLVRCGGIASFGCFWYRALGLLAALGWRCRAGPAVRCPEPGAGGPESRPAFGTELPSTWV